MPETVDPQVRFAYQVLAVSVIATVLRDVQAIAQGKVPRDLDSRTNSYCNRRLKTDRAYREGVLQQKRSDLEEYILSSRFALYLDSLKIGDFFTTDLLDALSGKPASLRALGRIMERIHNDGAKIYGTTGQGVNARRRSDGRTEQVRDQREEGSRGNRQSA